MTKKTKEGNIDERLDELFRNPRIRRTIINLGKGKGRAYKFLTKMRQEGMSNEEVAKWAKKECEKDEIAEIKMELRKLYKEWDKEDK